LDATPQAGSSAKAPKIVELSEDEADDVAKKAASDAANADDPEALSAAAEGAKRRRERLKRQCARASDAAAAEKAAEAEQKAVMQPEHAKLSVKELKVHLAAAGVSCVGATEKDDLVRLLTRAYAQSSLKVFVATAEWQPVPNGTALPPGLEIKMDTSKGVNYARFPGGKLPPVRAPKATPVAPAAQSRDDPPLVTRSEQEGLSQGEKSNVADATTNSAEEPVDSAVAPQATEVAPAAAKAPDATEVAPAATEGCGVL